MVSQPLGKPGYKKVMGSLGQKSLTFLAATTLSLLLATVIVSISHDVLADQSNSSIIAEPDSSGSDLYFITITDPDGIDYASITGSTGSLFFRIGPDFCDEDIKVLGPLSVRVSAEEFPLLGRTKDCQEPASIDIHEIPHPL